jgi:5'-methylthioadenosine phosphorylase
MPSFFEVPRSDVAQIGVFGGSGFYQLLENVEEFTVATPFGSPSDNVMVGEVEGVRIAFLPRHGRGHRLPPHKINFRANVWAMASLGVTRLIGPTAAGSLQPHVKPGDFVICDQFVDRTYGREQTFFDGPLTAHVSAADPYCPQMRSIAETACEELEFSHHAAGTVVVIQGPRFSTRAESKWFSAMGWEVINMTNYPEAILPRELELCYANVALITDYDVGLEGQEGVTAVTNEEVLRVFAENNVRVRELIFRMIPRLAASRTCSCGSAMQGAAMG